MLTASGRRRAATRGSSTTRRAPAQRRIGHTQRFIAGIGDDAQRRRHARQQPARSIGRIHHHSIGHHILHRGGREANFLDAPAQRFIGVGRYCEGHILACPYTANIGFIHGCMHFHLIQAGGDLEQDGGLKGSRDSLADINIARHHHAINWRFDCSVPQIHLHLTKLRNFLFTRRNGGFHLRFRRAGGGGSR